MSLPHDWNRYEAAVENVAMSYIGNRRNDEDYPLRTIYMNDWKEMALSDEQKRSVGQLNGEGLHAVLVKLDDMAEKIKKTATHKKTNKCAEMVRFSSSSSRLHTFPVAGKAADTLVDLTGRDGGISLPC